MILCKSQHMTAWSKIVMDIDGIGMSPTLVGPSEIMIILLHM